MGCGTGGLARFVEPASYCGVDRDEDSLSRARSSFPRHQFSADIPPSQCFDVVAALAVVEHLADPLSSLTEWRRVMPKDGLIIITTPHPRGAALLGYGARFGVFSHDAMAEHKSLFDIPRMQKLARSAHLEIIQFRWIILGYNQLFVLRQP
jgi:SAM-dependent methyltransferase